MYFVKNKKAIYILAILLLVYPPSKQNNHYNTCKTRHNTWVLGNNTDNSNYTSIPGPRFKKGYFVTITRTNYMNRNAQ